MSQTLAEQFIGCRMDCSTCCRATALGACGDPVHAGLSDAYGVIVYHPQDGDGCAIWHWRQDPLGASVVGNEKGTPPALPMRVMRTPMALQPRNLSKGVVR